MDYKDSGVDIHAGYKAVELMKSHIAKTVTKGVCSDVGGFGGLLTLRWVAGAKLAELGCNQFEPGIRNRH